MPQIIKVGGGLFSSGELIRINDFVPFQYNQVKGQPFVVSELVKGFEKIIVTPEEQMTGPTFETRVLQ